MYLISLFLFIVIQSVMMFLILSGAVRSLNVIIFMCILVFVSFNLQSSFSVLLKFSIHQQRQQSIVSPPAVCLPLSVGCLSSPCPDSVVLVFYVKPSLHVAENLPLNLLRFLTKGEDLEEETAETDAFFDAAEAEAAAKAEVDPAV